MRHRIRRALLSAAALALAGMLTACAAGPAGQSDEAEARSAPRTEPADIGEPCPARPNRIDPSGFTHDYSQPIDFYLPGPTLSDAVALQEVALSGCVAGWFEARPSGEHQEYHVDRAVVLALTVDRVVHGAGIARGSTAYLLMPDGYTLEPRGWRTSDPQRFGDIVERLRRAIPIGTRSIVWGPFWDDAEYRMQAPATNMDPAPRFVYVHPADLGLTFEGSDGRLFGGAIANEFYTPFTEHAAQLAGTGNGSVDAPGSFDRLLAEFASLAAE